MVDSDRLKLFVGGLSRETSDDVLREYFSRYGVVVECAVATDRTTGARRGFGFVTFGEPSAFEKALRDCHVILQKRVEVKHAIPRSEQLRNQRHNNGSSRNNHNTSNNNHFRTKKIFVGGLSPNLTENEFKSYFAQFGMITDIVVMQDNMTNRPRGFGFITFDSEETVEEVTKNSFHELGGKLVEVKRAVPKDEVAAKNSHRTSVENGTSSSRNQQFGNYVPYVDTYSSPTVYRPLILGYPYGSPIPFAPLFPVPVSPLMSPFYYPAYSTMNGVMYNGFLGVYKNDFGNGYGDIGANVSSVQITEISN